MFLVSISECRNPLFIKSEFSPWRHRHICKRSPRPVAILYSSSQNSLGSMKKIVINLQEIYGESQSFIHQVRILSSGRARKLTYTSPVTVAILYSSSQNSLAPVWLYLKVCHALSQSFIHQVRILSRRVSYTIPHP